MELIIVKETADSLGEAFGISDERCMELAKKMDDMVASFGGGTVRACNVFNEIAGFCNTTEELVYCTVTHCNYHALHGKIHTTIIKK